MREETKNPEEKIVVIQKTFDRFCQDLTSEFQRLEAETILDRETVNVLWDSLADLRDYFAQVSFTLANYDQWNFKKKINFLESEIQNLSKKIPRTKFRFKRRQKLVETVKTDDSKEKEQAKKIVETLQGISDRDGEEIVLEGDKLPKNFKLVNLKNCKVIMRGSLNLLFMKNIENCEVFTCPVANSIMIHEANNSTLSIISHQVRPLILTKSRLDFMTLLELDLMFLQALS